MKHLKIVALSAFLAALSCANAQEASYESEQEVAANNSPYMPPKNESCTSGSGCASRVSNGDKSLLPSCKKTAKRKSAAQKAMEEG